MKRLRVLNILDYVNSQKECSLEELMNKFNISIATVHRDIAELTSSGKLRKIRGGVAAFDDSFAITNLANHYQERLEANSSAKINIAEQSVKLIHDGDIIFLDSSTTVYYLAKILQSTNFSSLTIVTNSVLIIQEFPLFKPNYFLIGLGGNYDLQLNAFLGQSTIQELLNLSIDKAFFSALAITPNGITTRHENHAYFLRKVLENANKKYLLIGSNKFDKLGVFKVSALSEVDDIISDAPPPGYFYK